MLIGVFLDIAPTGRLHKPDLTQAYLDPAVGTLFTQMLEESGGASSFCHPCDVAHPIAGPRAPLHFVT